MPSAGRTYSLAGGCAPRTPRTPAGRLPHPKYWLEILKSTLKFEICVELQVRKKGGIWGGGPSFAPLFFRVASTFDLLAQLAPKRPSHISAPTPSTVLDACNTKSGSTFIDFRLPQRNQILHCPSFCVSAPCAPECAPTRIWLADMLRCTHSTWRGKQDTGTRWFWSKTVQRNYASKTEISGGAH